MTDFQSAISNQKSAIQEPTTVERELLIVELLIADLLRD
jgi:hypothetical protein